MSGNKSPGAKADATVDVVGRLKVKKLADMVIDKEYSQGKEERSGRSQYWQNFGLFRPQQGRQRGPK
ncbi:hypothetical protein ZHAS_00005176 [Anopheles sinensis]|uniref:Uncharacterized protein n=1 Tax=Anopheles sinensis TaxID=74873 RepID=A0A084VIR6_ANOSI|nr:hypothetical protein ZHAS_00005176 [Anopheles sinensis]